MLEPLDVNRETLLQLADLGKRFGISSSTIWRWVRHGNNGIVLAARRIGGRWYTSEEAFQRFCDQVTEASLGTQTIEPVVPSIQSRPSAHRQSLPKHRQESLRQAERSLRMMGFDGDDRIFNTSTVPKEVLCDLHEFLEAWMPGSEHRPKGAYKAVRSGLFARAVDMLEGKEGRKRSYDAVIEWINGINLHTFDVRTLPGIGLTYERDWKALLDRPGFIPNAPKPKD